MPDPNNLTGPNPIPERKLDMPVHDLVFDGPLPDPETELNPADLPPAVLNATSINEMTNAFVEHVTGLNEVIAAKTAASEKATQPEIAEPVSSTHIPVESTVSTLPLPTTATLGAPDPLEEEFKAMAADADYQKEQQAIANEFAGADAEAFAKALTEEDLPKPTVVATEAPYVSPEQKQALLEKNHRDSCPMGQLCDHFDPERGIPAVYRKRKKFITNE